MINTMNKVIYILLIASISSCYGYQTAEISGAKINEIVMFCGNLGVGKSTLCNSIFGQAVFESGLSLSTSMTAARQEHIHEGKLYIDTPGFDEVSISDQAAREIEEALKHNNNYKIVFVSR
jgi:putative ribosome biogenesis GTPase RsgA